MDDVVASLDEWAVAATAVVFTVLTVVAVRRARRAGPAGWWAAGMFASMAVFLAGTFVIPDATGGIALWLARFQLAVLLLFPYLLLRFAASFQRMPRWLDITAAAVAATLVLGTSLLSADPDRTDPFTVAYLAAVLVYWVVLSLMASARLWRAGRGQPTTARRRMRLMSVASVLLAVGLLVSGVVGGGESDVAQLVVLLIVLVSGAVFAIGFAPPRALVLLWQQPEVQQLQQAMMQVLRADTSADVAADLLPPVTRLAGGSGAALVATDGRVLASYGDAPAPASRLDAEEPAREDDGRVRQVVALEGADRGDLVVWTSRYSPFFAQAETDLLRTMGAFAALALDRCELLHEERATHHAVQEARREAERARDEADRANTAKSEFLSRMSHELRTPLNAVLGFGQLLELSELNDEDREGVGHIRKAGKHLLALINDVLDLSRVEAGTMTISLEPVNAAELIEDAVALIRPLAEERSIRLDVELAGCDQFVRTDRQRCRQILLNLLSNAVKYNHDRGEVKISCSGTPAGTTRVSVTDTGPGIEAARQERLFAPFERLGAETSGVEGTGLGLALTKHLVEAMDGQIGVESTRGVGSTFWIDLPAASPPAVADGEEAPVEPAAALSGSQSLLLVEDNLTNLRLVEAMLRRRPNVSVVAAMQGQLALDLAHQHRPDVIVLDLHLPDLPGRDVLNRLQADPLTRGIPVIIASADATPRRIRQLCDDGAFDYVTKPLDVQRFLEVVDAALARSEQERAAAAARRGE